MAVVALVALRITVGWHFFYEGVWKIANPDEFSASPFLTTAKGPAAPLFYAMIYDIDGRQRLASREAVTGRPLVEAWNKIADDARTRSGRTIEAEIRKRDKLDAKKPLGLDQADELRKKTNDAARPIEQALWQAEQQLNEWLAENQEAIRGLLGQSEEKADQKIEGDLLARLEALEQIEKTYLDAIQKIADADPAQKAALGSFGPRIDPWTPETTVGRVAKSTELRTAKGRPVLTLESVAGDIYLDAWSGQRDAAVKKFGMNEQQAHEAGRVYRQYAASIHDYFAENREPIEAYFGSLNRFEQAKAAGGDNAAYRKKRNWDDQQLLRAEANAWLGELDAMGEDYRLALHGLLDEGQKAKGVVPTGLTRSDLMDFAVTWSLTAIGFCMIVGLCNRLACLGGAGFLVAVLLTQPPWPLIYPPAPDVVGHALIVDKNFVEMMAMLALACLPVGRWGGLDAFLHRWFGRPLMKRFGFSCDE
ncbi:MAG: hypothetical protein GX621_04195 [Pirellulaceae bacterium]|nr:hypothetical protein [Pirellulaceae bacterium]